MEPKVCYHAVLSNEGKRAVGSITQINDVNNKPAFCADEVGSFKILNTDPDVEIVLGRGFGSKSANKFSWENLINPYKPFELVLEETGSKLPAIAINYQATFEYIGKTNSEYESIPTSFGNNGKFFNSVYEVKKLDTDDDGITDIVIKRKLLTAEQVRDLEPKEEMPLIAPLSPGGGKMQ